MVPGRPYTYPTVPAYRSKVAIANTDATTLNNVRSCWPTNLRPFARSLTLTAPPFCVCVRVCVRVFGGGGGVRGGSLLRNFRKSERYVPPHLKKTFHPWGSCLPKDPPFSANYINEDYYV